MGDVPRPIPGCHIAVFTPLAEAYNRSGCALAVAAVELQGALPCSGPNGVGNILIAFQAFEQLKVPAPVAA